MKGEKKTHVLWKQISKGNLYGFLLHNTLLTRDIILNVFPLRMMTSSNGNIFRVTGPLCGEFPGHRLIPLTKARNAELSFICAWINDSINNREAGDLRRHRAHYDVTVMIKCVLNVCLYILMLQTTEEVEFVMQIEGMSYAALGWRPAGKPRQASGWPFSKMASDWLAAVPPTNQKLC